MRILVRHDTTYRYSEPARFAIQRLRLTPRNCESQHVRDWRIEINRDGRLLRREDAFGNIEHCFSADGPFDSLTTTVEGEVETFDTTGVARGAVERFPPALYLRETALTAPDGGIMDLARLITAKAPETLARLHLLLGEIHESMLFDIDATNTGTSAAEAYKCRRGVCQDFAHVFVSVARALGAPARYVSGYIRRSDGVEARVSGHAWAEAYVDNLGWVGFDPAHKRSPDDAYIRVAIGLDYLGAAPVRGARIGGGEETMEVSVLIQDAQRQSQS